MKLKEEAIVRIVEHLRDLEFNTGDGTAEYNYQTGELVWVLKIDVQQNHIEKD